MSVIQRIEEVRKDYKLSQVDFCKKLAIHPTQYSKLKTGKSGAFTKSQMALFLKTFMVSEKWLTEGIGEKYSMKPELAKLIPSENYVDDKLLMHAKIDSLIQELQDVRDEIKSIKQQLNLLNALATENFSNQAAEKERNKNAS